MSGWWADAAGQLAFERSRAASGGQALRAWSSALVQHHRGRAGLSAADRTALRLAEARGRAAGLGYGAEDPSQTAPWHLPRRFASLRAAQLPPHPSIDASFLAAEWPALAERPALEVLAELTRPFESSDERWAGLPLWPAQPAGAPAPVAVCLHLYYLDLWPDLWRQLQHIPEPWDLLLSVPSFAAHGMLRRIVADHPRTVLWPMPNCGRDVAPFLRWQQAGALDRHALVCKLHGKHSPHRADGAAWRDSLLDGLLGSPARVQAVLARLASEPQLGLLAPPGALLALAQDPGRAVNARWMAALAQRLQLQAELPDAQFAAGTMFWCRPAALQRLRPLADDAALFPPEMRQTDGTPAHALERLIGAAVQAAGYRIASSAGPDLARA